MKLPCLFAVVLLIAGCAPPAGGSASKLEKPSDLESGWTWHEIEGENCGFAVPGDWKVMTAKEAQDEPPTAKGSMHDMLRGMAVNALAMSLVTRDRGMVSVSADPIAAAVMVTHRKEDAPVNLEDAQAQAAQQLASHTMKSETAPNGSTVNLPGGESKLVTGELSGTSSGQPDLKFQVHHYILAHGVDRYDIRIVSTSVGGSPNAEAEKIAESFRFVRKS